MIRFDDFLNEGFALFSGTIDLLHTDEESDFIYDIVLMVYDYKKGYIKINEILENINIILEWYKEDVDNICLKVIKLMFTILSNIYEMMEAGTYEKK